MIDFQLSDRLSSTEKTVLRKILPPRRIKRWVIHALKSQNVQNILTIRVVDEAEARSLNLSYRSKNYATNVLTFDYQRTPFLAADLVFCASVIEREAKTQNKTPEAHWAHLIIHGVLHAQGYEHESNEIDALEMESLEVLLMMSLGYPNPYEA